MVRDLDPNIAEGDAVHCARDPADRLTFVEQLVAWLWGAFDLEHAQAAVHLASMALAGDRLLARIAALREADVRVVQACLGRQDFLVELAAPAGDAGLDTPALELLLADLVSRGALVEDLVAAENKPCLVFLRLDLDLRSKARSQQLCPDDVTEFRLRREQEVVWRPPDNPQRRDDPRLRR